MKPIPERTGVTAEIFKNEILPAAQPVLMRGLVAQWPVVAAARNGPEAVCAYVRRFDRGAAVTTALGPASIKGRYFYNEDMSGFNYRVSHMRTDAVFDHLLAHLAEEPPSAISIQSVTARAHFPGLEAELPMPLIADVEPRVWVGSAGIVAAHHDPSENLACVAAGRRRFTLFPPEQMANLYIGPFELTPAGAAISLVDFDAPDRARFPKFADAEAAAMVAELAPGDVLYIPYLWWHHVRALDRFNMLVNYWWTPPAPGRGAAQAAMMHAILAVRDLPETHRAAWRAMFEHYVFKADGDPAAHIPAERRGVAGDLDAKAIAELRKSLVRALMRPE